MATRMPDEWPRSGPNSRLRMTLEQYRRRLQAEEAGQMREMARRWIQVEGALEARMQALTIEVIARREAGEVITKLKLMQLEQYRALIEQARKEVNSYSAWAADLIEVGQQRYAAMGVDAAMDAILAGYSDAGVLGASFSRLNVEAVRAAIGFAGDGTPLQTLLRGAYPDAVDGITDALVTAVGAGRGPMVTANLMREAFGIGLDRALTIARTEQLRAYREGNRQQFIKSGVVTGYVRRASLSERTCPACLALDGEEYDTDDFMAIHPNDRCVMEPKIIGVNLGQPMSGAEWFSEQPAEIQRTILGGQKYELYRDGQIGLKDMAVKWNDPTWGPTVSVATLRDLGVGTR